MSRAKSVLRTLLQYIKYLKQLVGDPNRRLLQVFRNVIGKLVENKQIAELLRFLFLGTVVETTRQAGEKVVEYVKNFFVVKATFASGDFAYDWVKRYLEDNHVWDNSRLFQVSACDAASINAYSMNTVTYGEDDDLTDGHARPLYQPAPEEPVYFFWKGYWISVNLALGSNRSSDLTLSVWSRNRRILDEFVRDARAHYLQSPTPPRRLYKLPDDCGALLTARFKQGDSSYDWMVVFVRAHSGYDDINDLEVTTKHSELVSAANSNELPLATYRPAQGARQVIRWRSHWLQLDVVPANPDYEGKLVGGSITVTLHNSKKSVLHELVMAAREEYLKSTTSKVTVHLSEQYRSWAKTITKNRRSLNSVNLPEGVKETLVEDVREFLASEEWYTWAGVPYRRGYLLHGEPGTGKSSTIHAIASELGLEIYYVQLSSQGMTDSALYKLIADTPSRSILLLEDIDCAFPSREDEEEEDDDDDSFEKRQARIYRSVGSGVTLSGLLNALDSVTSEDGRVTFATTNHIERLDPALIRDGRMDVKIEYKLATRSQILSTFVRIFGRRFVPASNDLSVAAMKSRAAEVLSDEEKQSLAELFADKIPEGTFSLAQIQGYLLTKKTDPRKAVEHVEEWVQRQVEEQRKLQELKDKKAQRKRERKQRQREAQQAQANYANYNGGASLPMVAPPNTQLPSNSTNDNSADHAQPAIDTADVPSSEQVTTPRIAVNEDAED